MKKILSIICVLIVSFNSFGQAFPVVPRTNSSYTVQDSRFSAGLNLFVPKYADTTAANSGTNEGNDSLGAIIFTYNTMSLWVRSGSPKNWVAVGAATGSPGTWGSITGTLSSQTDLQNALNLKANLASPTFTGTVTMPTPFTLGAVSVLPTGTELNFVDGVTSSIQTQLDARVLESKIGADFVVSNDSLKNNGFVNVRDFGAIGDGVTNNTTAFQNAVNTGKPVYVPPGTYLLSTQVSLSTNQTIFGQDWSSIIKITANTRAIGLDSGSHVIGLKFIGNGKAGSGAFNTGVYITSAVGWSVENCMFQDFAGDPVLNGGGGVFASSIGSANSDGGRVVNCYFYNNDAGLNLATRAEYVTASNNTFGANTCAILGAAGNLTINNNIIQNNTTGFKSISATNGAHSTINNNLLNHNTYPIWIEDATYGLGFTFGNNMVYFGAIVIKNSANIKFVGGHFGSIDSVHLDNATYLSRTGTWWGQTGAAATIPVNKYNGAEDFSVFGETRPTAAIPNRVINIVHADTIYSAGPSYLSATTFSSAVNLGTAGTTLGQLLFNGNTSGTITLQSAAAAGTYTLTLPTTDGGASEFLQTDGNGVLSWVAGGTGNVSNTGTPVDNQLAVWTNATTLEGDADLVFNGTQLGIQGTPGFALDIWTGTIPGIVVGAEASASTRTNNTNKFGVIAVPSYANANPPFALIRGAAGTATNTLVIGGGIATTSSGAQTIEFYTSATPATTSFNKRADVTLTSFRVNSDLNNYDFIVSGDVDANTLVVDANALTNGAVGIGVAPGSLTEKLTISGNIALLTAGNKIIIATGSNASVGISGAMTAGSITISTTAVTANSIIQLTPVGAGTGQISIGTITAGTSFVINSSDGADIRIVHWTIIN